MARHSVMEVKNVTNVIKIKSKKNLKQLGNMLCC